MKRTGIVICSGSGGVGKTSCSAALALALARLGARVAVITIDPARRLADALGVGPLGDAPQAVDLTAALAEPVSGTLAAMMLDRKATFDAVVRRYASRPEVVERILANRYYQFVSTRLAGSHEYMAMERLYTLHESGDYDWVVLDTPPARHALDFLRAPERIEGVMNERVVSWLSTSRTGGGWRVLRRTSEKVLEVLERLLGGTTLSDIAEFFTLFEDLAAGFSQRSRAVAALLKSSDTHFLLITGPSPTGRREEQAFLDEVLARGVPLAGVVVNRVALAPQLPAPPLVAFPAPAPGWSPEDWEVLVRAVTEAPERQRELARQDELALRGLLQLAGDRFWRVPEIDDPTEIEALQVLVGHLTPPAQRLLRG